MTPISRRAFVIAMPLFLSACATRLKNNTSDQLTPTWNVPPEVAAMYGAITTEPYRVPAVDMSHINPRFWRQIVDYPTSYSTGTLIVDTNNRFIYLIMENGKALRYGVGVGKAGLALEGEAVVEFKRQWPRWTPTRQMMEREPARYGSLGAGMAPGEDNPLGARALYLYRDGRDTLFRIHGSHEEWSIGRAVSSGCIRLLNQDIIDLYGRVPSGTRVVVLQHEQVVAAVD